MPSRAQLQVPVALIVFNRPDLAARVLDRVLAVRPRLLLVIADGPRPHVPTDADACRRTRALFDDLGPAIEVRRQYASANLGLRHRVTSGLDWVFDQVDRATIVEDDCLADPSFFDYCTALLDRFADDDRVGSITGSNVTLDRCPVRHPHHYHFSALPVPWGWATWATRWKQYDAGLQHWAGFRDSGWLAARFGPVVARQWTALLDAAESFDSWWIRWCATHWEQAWLSAVPRNNLVSNIGMDARATHTTQASSWSRLDRLAVCPLTMPVRHPELVLHDPASERLAAERLLPSSSLSRVTEHLWQEGLRAVPGAMAESVLPLLRTLARRVRLRG